MATSLLSSAPALSGHHHHHHDSVTFKSSSSSFVQTTAAFIGRPLRKDVGRFVRVVTVKASLDKNNIPKQFREPNLKDGCRAGSDTN
ncbi:hypothetical protein Tco_1412336 [Tanacetum coccineum]